MDQTLRELGGILLKAIPTVCLLLVVHIYLRWMFFGPLRKILAKRREATEGARESAEVLLAKAASKAAAIEAELRKARDEIYQEQEEARRRWTAEQSASLEAARLQSREMIQQAKVELDAEAAAAKRELAATTVSLAEQITQSLLQRKAS
jgi:F0F1-type ATP synthase membrane subunit b/b'